MTKSIIYAGPFRFPEGDAAASRVLGNCQALKALGYDVLIVSFGGRPRVEDKTENGDYVYKGFRYINTYDIDLNHSNIFKRIYSFLLCGSNALKIIKKNIIHAKGVIIYQPPLYFTKEMSKLCLTYNVKLISDLTEWYSPQEFPGGIIGPPAWLNELNMLIMQKKIKFKIVISSYLSNIYKSSYNLVLPPLIDHKETKWTDFKTVLPKFHGIRIIYAGTPNKKDSLESMLQAVLKCLNQGLKLQFIILGVTNKHFDDFKNKEQILQYPENIVPLGRVPQHIVPSYYAVADFSILIRERTRKNMAGFPTKLVESMMASCPPIVNSTSDIGLYVKSGYNGFLINDSNVKNISDVLMNINTLSLDEISNLKKNAYRTALNAFDYRLYKAQFQDLILK